jgi:hypothetical protein
VAIDFESVLRNISKFADKVYTMATVPAICFLIIVMVLILILSTLTSVQSFENVGNVDVMQDASLFASQYAPVEHYDDEMGDPEDTSEQEAVVLNGEGGELVQDGGALEPFEGGELHAFEAPPVEDGGAISVQ